MSAYEAFGPLAPPVEIVATDIARSVLVHARGGASPSECGAAADAVAPLRRALWLDGSFGLAAFALGRAYDLSGDRAAAARANRRALRALGIRRRA